MKQDKTVTTAFATGQKAATVLKGLLPDTWLFREQQPDFHIDFMIEVVESGELTGINFGVQLKGSTPKKGNAFNLKQSLKKKHLRYYLHKATVPVFLVLVDVVNGKGYWCFTQQYAHDLGSRLEKGRTVSVPFRDDDCFSDLARFKQALLASINYVRDLHPGSIQAAVEAEKARLRVIDPRLDVTIAMLDGQRNVTLTANQQFEFKATVTGRDTAEFRQAFLDFIEKGGELKVDSSAIQFEGAPLLSHAFAGSDEGCVIMKFARELNGAMQAFAVAESPEFLFQADGKFRCGTKYATFEGSLPNSALSITTMVCAEKILNREPQNFGLSFIPDKWTGQPIMQMAYFDAIHRFVRDINNSRPIKLKFLSNGNDLFSVDFRGLDPKSIEEISDILDLLHKARFMARRYNLNPPLPPLGSISGSQLKAIEDMYDLLCSGEARVPMPRFRLPFKASGGGHIRTDDSQPGVLRIDSLRHDFDFLGGRIQLGPISHFFTRATLASATPLDDGGTDIVMTGSDKSEWIMKLQNPPTREMP